jgi:hypothetical protein
MTLLRNFLVLLVALLGGATLLQFCVKPPDYPDEPRIEFVSLSTTVMPQRALASDSVIITISYTDGDGDLGSTDGGSGVFLLDGRDEFPKPPFQIPAIEQQGTGNGISGEISVVVENTCCIFPGLPPCDPNAAPQPYDTLFYYLYITDKAGHHSDTIRTPPILLICKN